jgi:hypothetical protein
LAAARNGYKGAMAILKHSLAEFSNAADAADATV